MTITKSISTFLLGTALVALQACSNKASLDAQASVDAPEATAVKSSSNNQYQKPGAAVRFSDDYDGHTDVGEIESFSVFVNEQYEFGSLDINISTSDGLALNSGASQANFALGDDTDNVINISVSAQAAGKYYIHFHATADDGNGQAMVRASSIAIYVGNKSDYTKPKNTLKVENTESGRIIVMDAEETVQ